MTRYHTIQSWEDVSLEPSFEKDVVEFLRYGTRKPEAGAQSQKEFGGLLFPYDERACPCWRQVSNGYHACRHEG